MDGDGAAILSSLQEETADWSLGTDKQIDTTVLEVNALNTDVQNAFNKFRALSNVQFMENCWSMCFVNLQRVYEDDEDEEEEAIAAEGDASGHHPEVTFEQAVLPKYETAARTGWAAVQFVYHRRGVRCVAFDRLAGRALTGDSSGQRREGDASPQIP
eukprot:1128774-Prorocentrum_minimum.AAC.2